MRFYYLGHVNSDNGKEPAAAGGSGLGIEESVDRGDVAKEWEQLKVKIKFLDPEKAHQKVAEFTARYGSLVPAEVETVLDGLKMQDADLRRINEFEDKLETFDLEIHAADFNKLPNRKLLELKKRINAVLAESERDIKLQPLIPPENRKLYAGRIARINEIIAARKKAIKVRRRLEALAKKRKKGSRQTQRAGPKTGGTTQNCQIAASVQ